jgi:ubiquinone/menaquinone biosynthesis C-methylase UbiE
MSVQHVPVAQPNPQRIFDTVQGYQRAFVLKAAVDLEVFTAIAKGRHTVAEIAKACAASERGVRILCDFLVILGFLSKSDNLYTLTDDTAFFLDTRSPGYLGKALKFLLHPAQLKNIEDLTETVRQGSCAPDQDTVLSADDPLWVDFARGMAPMMYPAAQAIARLLQPALSVRPAPKVLDIAAGHGVFGITVAQQVTQAEIYAVDWPNVLEVAQENARAQSVAGRYHLLPGSAFDVDFGADYDAVLLTNFLHHFGPPTNESLLKKIHMALIPGGQVVILEFVPNDDRVSPPIPAMFSMTMLSNTSHGDAYTFTEFGRMCRNAGFEDLKLVGLEPMPQSLVVARKPF